MSKNHLIPQCFQLPILRKPEGIWIDARIERKKLSKVLSQSVGGVYDVQPITNDGKNKICALCSCGRLRNEGVVRVTRHQRTYPHCPVPKTGVMRTDIANINQSVEPRNKDCITNSKGCCHIALCTSRLQVLIENGHRTKRGDFKSYPTWGQRIVVFTSERPYKLFVAALKFIVNTCKSLGMLRRIGEKTGITKPVTFMSQRHDIGHLGADCNFYAFYSGENYMSQMTVEFIEHLCLLKGTARFKDMILSVCQKRVPVTAHSIVTDFVEPFFCFLFIGYHQTTLLQNANLISKCLDMFWIRYFVHHNITKKAHPKRAVLREAG